MQVKVIVKLDGGPCNAEKTLVRLIIRCLYWNQEGSFCWRSNVCAFTEPFWDL